MDIRDIIVKGGDMRYSELRARILWLVEYMKKWQVYRDEQIEKIQTATLAGEPVREVKTNLFKCLNVIKYIKREIIRLVLYINELSKKDIELDIIINIHPKFHAHTKNVLEDEQCSICFESLSKSHDMVYRTDCNHLFHAHCILAWKEKTCPLCRHEYKIEKIA